MISLIRSNQKIQGSLYMLSAGSEWFVAFNQEVPWCFSDFSVLDLKGGILLSIPHKALCKWLMSKLWSDRLNQKGVCAPPPESTHFLSPHWIQCADAYNIPGGGGSVVTHKVHCPQLSSLETFWTNLQTLTVYSVLGSRTSSRKLSSVMKPYIGRRVVTTTSYLSTV